MPPAAANPGHATTFLDALATAALLGTARTGGINQLTPPGALAARAATLPKSDAEAALLELAAAASPWSRAGRASDPIEALPPLATDESLPYCNAATASKLVTLLRSQNRELQAEWIDLARRHSVLAPPESLPGLLEAGKNQPAMRDSVRAVIGQRGRWLAAMHPDWQYATEHETSNLDDLWQTGARDQRIAVLRQVRRADPARAVALLQQTWAGDSHEDRAAFLPELAHGLSMADEPFLESCLDNKRKSVRTAAIPLLARLPESGFVQRMTGRAAALLTFDPGKGGRLLKKGAPPRITATLPAAYDKSWARDGIDEKPPQGIGERAWWLQQMLSLTPPSVWTSLWGVEPATLLAAAEEGDWHTMLLTAWSAAAIASGDQDWAEAILLWWIDALRAKAQHYVRQQELLQTLDPPRRERFVLEQLRLKERARLGTVIDMMNHRWSAEFSRAILDYCERHKPIFDLPSRLACFHHTAADEVIAFLDRTGRLATLGHDARRHLFNLEFRAQMHREFTP